MREVRPREAAWDRLAERLDAEGPARRRPAPRLWMGLAAAGILLLIGLTFFWQEPVQESFTNPVVETPAEERTAPANQATAPVTSPSPMPSRSASPVASRGDEIQEDPPLADTNPSPVEVARQDGGTKPRAEQLVGTDTSGLATLIDRQLDTLLTRVAALEERQESVSDAQIDSLLREAQEAIARQKPAGTSAPIAPGDLLAQAEEELDQTFREQIFEKLKTGFQRVRTAVADRNQ